MLVVIYKISNEKKWGFDVFREIENFEIYVLIY